MAVGKYKPVTVRPIGILGIVCHDFSPQNLGDIGHAHRGSGVSGIRFLYTIHT